MDKAHARADELEKQVRYQQSKYLFWKPLLLSKCCLSLQIDNLKKESEKQQREKEALEARATEAEKKISDLSAKLEKVRLLFGRITQWFNFIVVLSLLSLLFGVIPFSCLCLLVIDNMFR